jgi:hypothetical protein
MIIPDQDNLKIQKEIESLVLAKEMSYMDSILFLCEKYSVEPELMAKCLSKPIIQKLKEEGEILNLLPKTTKLKF